MTTQPLLLPAADAFAMIGVGNSKGYELIRNGQLEARKIGCKKTVITYESIQRFVAALPDAGLRRPAASVRPKVLASA